MLKYHAKLEGVKLERPVGCFGDDLQKLMAWARETVKKFPSGSVEINEVREELVARIAGTETATSVSPKEIS